jgi:hypothetical protein
MTQHEHPRMRDQDPDEPSGTTAAFVFVLFAGAARGPAGVLVGL